MVVVVGWGFFGVCGFSVDVWMVVFVGLVKFRGGYLGCCFLSLGFFICFTLGFIFGFGL